MGGPPVGHRQIAADGTVASPGEEIVVSGGAVNPTTLEGRPAILAVPKGDGLILAYNFNPIHRDLNRSDFRMLWNGILNWSELRPLKLIACFERL